VASRSRPRRSVARGGIGQHEPTPVDWTLGNLTELIEASGHILVGKLDPIPCAAIAYDGSAAVAMLRRRTGETVPQLLQRLDAAVAEAQRSGIVIDEVNT
jgi:hypothetical protein